MDEVLNEKRIEKSLSTIQARMADMKELLLSAAEEIDDLYMQLGEEPNERETEES